MCNYKVFECAIKHENGTVYPPVVVSAKNRIKAERIAVLVIADEHDLKTGKLSSSSEIIEKKRINGDPFKPKMFDNIVAVLKDSVAEENWKKERNQDAS